MTKTLTEQWRDGRLPDGEYYVKDWNGKIDWFLAKNKILWRDNNNPMYASERIEVLAPVPSYEQFIGLMDDSEELDKAYDKIKRLQEQLHEANKLISLLFPLSMNKERALESTKEYMGKWGVK